MAVPCGLQQALGLAESERETEFWLQPTFQPSFLFGPAQAQLALFPPCTFSADTQAVKMINDEGQMVDLYIPRKW